MGFGRFLGGTLCAIGAVIAAPVVLPALGAAAAGAAAAGVAAAGTAAAAAGTAVATAGATAAAAVTSTVVGGAVAGAATTAAAGLGIGVANAAGAVGLSTMAAVAGTTTGAAALGTITAAGAVGITSGVSGAIKMSEAQSIKTNAMSKYETEKAAFDKTQASTNAALEKLGKEKAKIWESFDRFVIMFSKIQNPPVMNANVDKESIALSAEDLDNIKAVAVSVKELLSGGMGSVSAGGFIGMATSGGMLTTVTAASTGTAMSSLSGAAAANATLAAFGGGSLAAGGAGMAGGAAVLSGLTFAPMLMVGGMLLNGKGKKSLEDAMGIDYETDLAVSKMNIAEKELKKIRMLSNKIRVELEKLNKIYKMLMDFMEVVVEEKTNYRTFTAQEKRQLEKTTLVLKLIKQLSMQNILDAEDDNAVLEEEVKATLSEVARISGEKLASKQE